jgi:signal transduction histidine kinase
MAGSLLFVLAILFYIRAKILMPFNRLTEIPEELAKGNLTVPIKEEKNKYFGRFVWGLDLLREQLEDKKKADLEFEKQKKTLLLSLSHDIKTPLSAIKLSAKAIERGLYKDPEKQTEIAKGINKQADEIEEYISHIITASRDDFLNLEVNNSEFYLDEIIGSIRDYYRDRLKIDRTAFVIDEYTDCLLKGDRDRAVEVLQNIMENALKYGDGKEIHISFDAEEDCRLVSISNTGERIPEDELHHIFDSFYRGSNSTKKAGSGLGLYICRKLMKEMDGDVFAAEGVDRFTVTVVFRKG